MRGAAPARAEDGASAVLLAVVMVVVLGVAAMSVDLGNAWARKRAVQRQVDVATTSAAHLLPARSTNRDALLAAVAAYLNSNAVAGQPSVTATDLSDTDPADGRVDFEHADGSACTPSGAVVCEQMTVTAPAADVDFALAGVFGSDRTSVQRSATVRVFSALPRKNLIIPFWLPSGCGPGPVAADATGERGEAGCSRPDRGNFGQIINPRGNAVNKTVAALNLALGLDHTLAVYPFTRTKEPRQRACAGLTAALNDSVSQDDRNCIIGDPGNDGGWLLQGLVTGIDGQAGRLDHSRGDTVCPGRSNTVVAGTTINNDVLSCFLINGATLSAVTNAAMTSSPTQPMIDPSIVDSPRFGWVPVVAATDRAEKSWQPIVDFLPVFITDETPTAPATTENGLKIAGGGNMKSVQVLVFNKHALPVDEQSPTMDYEPDYGRELPRLVH